MKRQLTIKQENFCHKYVECGNASQAYRHAYSCDRWKDKSVWEKSSVLLSDVKVQSRVKELQAELQAKSVITKERILEEHAKLAFSSIASMHNSWIERKDFDCLTPDQKASIKSISTKIEKRKTPDGDMADVEFIKIELYDKQRSLDSLSKMLGFDAPVKHEVTGKNGEPLHPKRDLSRLNDEELQYLQKLSKKTDVQ